MRKRLLSVLLFVPCLFFVSAGAVPAGPRITSFSNHTIVPANWLHPLVEWKDTPGAAGPYQLRISGASPDLLLEVRGTRLVLDDPRFAPFLAGPSVRFEVSRAGAPSSVITVEVDGSALQDTVVYRLVQPLFNPGQEAIIETRRLIDAGPVRYPPTPALCIGCHSYSQGRAAANARVDTDRRLVTAVAGSGGADPLPSQAKPGEFSFLAYSPDGKTLALVTRTVSAIRLNTDAIEPFDMIYTSGDISLFDLASGRASVLPGASSDEFVEDMPSWSPDGRSLVFVRYSPVPLGKEQTSMSLYTIDVNDGRGGIPRPLLASPPSDFCYFPHWSPDGKWISFVTGDARDGFFARQSSNIWLYSTADGRLVKAAFDLPDGMESWHGWSGDSKWLVFSSKRDGSSMTALYISRIRDDGKAAQPFKLGDDVEYKCNLPSFAPPGAEGAAATLSGYLRKAFGSP